MYVDLLQVMSTLPSVSVLPVVNNSVYRPFAMYVSVAADAIDTKSGATLARERARLPRRFVFAPCLACLRGGFATNGKNMAVWQQARCERLPALQELPCGLPCAIIPDLTGHTELPPHGENTAIRKYLRRV